MTEEELQNARVSIRKWCIFDPKKGVIESMTANWPYLWSWILHNLLCDGIEYGEWL
ncbi:MAG: hypothetical protein ACXADL_07350 [Candidatus Thorarchaeota archaeon]